MYVCNILCSFLLSLGDTHGVERFAGLAGNVQCY